MTAPRKSTRALGGHVPTITRTCERCGLDWHAVAVRGRYAKNCPSCTTTSGKNQIDTNTAGYRLALCVTNYRVAIELALTAIHLGKTAEAAAVLERTIRSQAPQPRGRS